MAKRVIGVISGKGGVGKTTLSVNLGAIAALNGADVVLIDGDIGNPGVGLHLGLWGYSSGLQQVLAGKYTAEQATIIHPATGIRVLPSTLEYERGAKLSNLKNVVKAVAQSLAIIDSPPGVSSAAEDILSSCTEAIILVTPDIPSVMGAAKIIELAKECNTKVSGLVLNRVQNKKYEMHPREIEHTCEARVLAVIPEDKAVPESISARIPVVMYAPNSPVSIKLHDLASELDLVSERTVRIGSGGFFAGIRAFFRRIFGGE
jgi:septum site-determining protein MinD